MDASIMKMIKSLKTPYIKLQPNYISGTDLSLSRYSIIFEQPSEVFVGTVQELEGGSRPDWVNTRYDVLSRSLDNKFNICIEYLNKTPIYHEDNIRKANPIYNDIIGMKKADGARPINLYDNYIMYLSPGLCAINKPDLVSADIYPYDNISFMVVYTVFKKDYKIHQFMRCHNLI